MVNEIAAAVHAVHADNLVIAGGQAPLHLSAVVAPQGDLEIRDQPPLPAVVTHPAYLPRYVRYSCL